MEEKQEIKQETLESTLALPTGDNIFDEFFESEETKDEDIKGTPYTTELLSNIQEIDPTLTVEEVNEMVNYLKGSGRPEFMEKMMTQTNEKLVEAIKIMAILYLNRVPALLDYQNVLQKNLLDTSKISNMSFDEISKTSANIQREINDLLNFSLNVAKTLNTTNQTPTKVEKLANALMNVPDSTRQRIEEIIRIDSQG